MVALHYPCCGPAHALGQDDSVPATIRRERPTFRFSRDILVPTTSVLESCSLSGQCPPAAHALRAWNDVQYIAATTSMQALPALQSGAPIQRGGAVQPSFLSSKSRWATSPPRKMALGPLQASHWPPKCSPRSCPAGCASLLRSLKHRRTSATLLRYTAQRSNANG